MDDFEFNVNANMDEDFFSSLHTKKVLHRLFVEEFENNNDNAESQQQKSFKHQSAESNAERLLEQQQQYNNEDTILWTTVAAKVVTAYKQQQDLGKLCNGKVGIALLSSSTKTSKLHHDNNNDAVKCKLLLYKTKNHILESLVLNKSAKQLYKQKGRYLQFMNPSQEYWVTVQFENECDEEEFHKILLSYDYKVYEGDDSNNDEDDIDICAESNYKSPEYKIKEEEVDVNNSKPMTRQTLIMRMSKMGKALPQLNPMPTSSFKEALTNSSDTEVINMPSENLNRSLNQPILHEYTTLLHNHKQLIPNCKIETAAKPSLPKTDASLLRSISNTEAQYIPMLLTEQRTQNAELRWNVNKLEEKIEKVLDKLEKLETKTGRHRHDSVPHYQEYPDMVIELEEKIIELKKENRRLNSIIDNFNKQLHHKKYNNEKEASAENITISLLKDLETEHYEFLHEQNILMNPNIEIKTFLNELIINYQELNEKYKTKLQTNEQEMSENKLIVEKLKQELTTLKDNNMHLKKQEEQFIQQLEEHKRIEKGLNNKLNSLSEENFELNNQLKQLHTENLSKETYCEEKQLEIKLKAIMNNIYTDLSDQFQVSYPKSQESHHILSLMAAAFKEHTLKVLQTFPSTSLSCQ